MSITKFCMPIFGFQRYEKTSSFSFCLIRCISNKESADSQYLTENSQPKPKLRKGGLRAQHRNILNQCVLYNEPHSWIHLTEKYQRKCFGRFGIESGVNPRICFNTMTDLLAQKEYKSVSEPISLADMIQNVKRMQAEKQQKIKIREETITKNLSRLDQWKQDLAAKIAKKEADARAVKERKERLIEDVRRHFGFTVDPKDERFKEMLEQKDREDRKKQKLEKRKAKEAKVLSSLTESYKSEIGNST